MNFFTGMGKLIRHIVRRDRIRLGIWVLVLAVLPIAVANAFFELTPTEVDRQRMVGAAALNPAFNSLLGPAFGTSIGALTAWRVGTMAAVLVGLMSVLTVIRHTREEEETGRAELLGSTVVGRLALTGAGFLAVAIAALTLAIVTTLGLAGLGLPFRSSGAFGLGFGLVAICFGAFAALAAQIPDSASAARGIGVGVIGAAFLLRAVGDATEVTYLSWLSPIGWFTQLRPYADERWWVLGLLGGVGLGALGTALALASRRDVGAGVLSSRRGPASAAPSLRSALALSLRLQRGAWLGWTLGLGTLAVIYGSIANSVDDLVASNPQLGQIFERLGGQQRIVDTFFATALGILALIASAYAVRTVFVLRVEEDQRRAEPVLATAVSRPNWMVSHVLVALIGSALMLVFAAAMAGTTYGLLVDDVRGQVPRVMEAAAWHLPAVWVLVGIAALLFGLAPGLTNAAWGCLVAFLVFGQLGPILQLPQWVLDLSPFTHVPTVPFDSAQVTPIAVLLLIASVLLALGVTGFQRRDLRTP